MELADLVRQGALDDGLDPAQLGRALHRLAPGLSMYALGPWPARRTLALETAVRLTLADKDGFAVDIHLRLDRVVELGAGVAIIDFKTVPPHRAQMRADEWQLRTYALALPVLLGRQPSSVRLFVIDVQAGREVRVGAARPVLDEARRELLACARGITAANFEVGRDHPDRPCWSCGFRLTCRRSLAPDPPHHPG